MNIPHSTALTVLHDIPLEEVAKLIDWRMYLVSWDFRTDKVRKSPEALELLKESRVLLDRIIQEKLLSVEGVIRILPAATIDYDDILLYKNEKRDEIIRQLPMLRRQIPMLGDCPSLADFIVPVGDEPAVPGIDDHMGFFTVTAGKKVEETIKKFPDHDLYSPLLVKSLADRLAEAGAEYIHKKVRREFWGYENSDDLSVDEILKEKYQGIRPAPGYPCCPDHTGKQDIFEILEVEKSIGVTLTESFMMQPAASVCGYIFASEKSRYFPVGPIGEDQLESYSERKQMPVNQLKHWLSVNVNN
jgi:5-methyltetrahydrofolate--homocysteine methyltransferase